MHWSFMMAKRLDIRAGLVVVLLSVTGPAVVQGQLSGGEWHLPTGTAGKTGVVPKPQPQIVIVQPQSPRYHRVFPRYPGGATVVPALMLADGRVFADFGFGYEPVYRSCSSAVVVGQPRVIAGNGVVLSPAAPTYTQPVPNQQTASQQMATANGTRNVVVSGAQTACFSSNGAGQIFVYRF
jgi:hypothetical protein